MTTTPAPFEAFADVNDQVCIILDPDVAKMLSDVWEYAHSALLPDSARPDFLLDCAAIQHAVIAAKQQAGTLPTHELVAGVGLRVIGANL